MRCVALVLCLFPVVTATQATDWPTALPEEVGIDSAPLVELFDFVRERNIPVHSLQIVRHGRLAVDAYFFPFSPGVRHDVASVTKSVTSTLVGLAVDNGVLNTQQRLIDLFPEKPPANLDPRKRKLTLEHLLTMQAGWDCGFEPKEARLFEMRRSADWLQFMLELPMVADPGTRWAYCSGNCHVLSTLLSNRTGTNALSFARRELFGPLGIEDVAWTADPRGNNHGWGDLQLHPRDMARIGQLFLQRGQWNDRQILSESWVRAATSAQVERTSNKDHYGYFWWVKGKDFPGMFEAVGRGGQRITVWPAKDVVVVFTGGGFEPGDLAAFLLKAIRSEKSLPPNPKAFARFRERLAAAERNSVKRSTPKLPRLAAAVSGKNFRVTGAGTAMSRIALDFSSSAEAKVNAEVAGQPLAFPAGLDGLQRFSNNPLNGLAQAAKGEWVTDRTFLLDLDFVGGINHYLIKLTFSDDGKRMKIVWRELTGLGDDEFTAVLVE